ncbi:MAG: DUF1700 domain-containing protein [Oscillospiraceae bacterium]|nr:DUF1700 domain-containing protein [Oscillospiraceae bacterium]
MNKKEFLAQLRKGLSGLPREDIEDRLAFYSEMIEDRMEEGFSEKEAVSAIGSVDEIVSQIVADTSLVKIAKERIKPKRRLKAWEIVLLAVGSPIWLSLGIAAIAVVLALYIVLWAVMLSLWAVFGAVLACGLGGMAGGIVLICNAEVFTGIALVAAGILCVGLSIFLFFGCKAATKGIFLLTKKYAVWIKNRFRKKEEM